jgi:hypothetical protein
MKKAVIFVICFVVLALTFCAAAYFLKTEIFMDAPIPIERTTIVVQKEEIYLPSFTLVSEEINVDQLNKAESTSKYLKVKKDISFFYKITAVIGSNEKPQTIVQGEIATVYLPRMEVLYVTAPTDIKQENLNTGSWPIQALFGSTIGIDTIVEALTVDIDGVKEWISHDEKIMETAATHFRELYETELKDLNPQIRTVKWNLK